MPWAHFQHMADIGIRGIGDTLEEAFAEAAVALTAVITDPARVEPREAVSIEREAPDIEFLFLDWINALIYEMATRDMLFSRFEVHINGKRLQATARGEPKQRTKQTDERQDGPDVLPTRMTRFARRSPLVPGVIMDKTGLKQLDATAWEIPPDKDMHVPTLLAEMDDKVREQIRNVATLPGIVKAAWTMPDAHWGYGFPIGGVAAFDPEEVVPRAERLADALFAHIPAGVGSTGRIRLNAEQMDAMLEGGASWAVGQGYGEPADLERIEEQGRMEGARPEHVSAHAKKRQRDEVGTLRWARSAPAITIWKCSMWRPFTMRASPRSSACAKAMWW